MKQRTMDEFCVKCRRKMKVAEVGKEVVELVARGGKPYRHMVGDILEWPECGCRVVTRFGTVTMQHDSDFEQYVEKARLFGFLAVV